MSELCYEVVISRSLEGTPREEVLAMSREIEAFCAEQPGFVRRTLLEAGDGRWIDLVLWESEEAAKAAAERFPQESQAKFARFMDVPGMQMLHAREA